MPAPLRFFRFVYDRESAAWARRREEPAHRALVEDLAGSLARVVTAPGSIADLGCGPGAHARALARRGYDVTGLDGSPRMVDVARADARRDDLDVAFAVHDVGTRLPFADASLGGVLAVLVVQHLPDPAAFVAEVRRCLGPGGHLMVTAPTRDGAPPPARSRYWQLRTAFYRRVPGVVRFSDDASLAALVEGAGLTVVEADAAPGVARVLARA